jgi:hypothetical protein
MAMSNPPKEHQATSRALSWYGDRMGTVTDPSGHIWSLATHVKEISPEELEKRGREEFEKMLQTSSHI